MGKCQIKEQLKRNGPLQVAVLVLTQLLLQLDQRLQTLGDQALPEPLFPVDDLAGL